MRTIRLGFNLLTQIHTCAQIKLIHLAGSGAPSVVGLEDRISALKAELAKHPAPAVAG